MAISRINLAKQLAKSSTKGSILATNGDNELQYIAPPASNVLWGYDHGELGTIYINIGTNLSYDSVTNTLNASAGAGGYSEIQEEGSALTARTKINFVGAGLTATDDAANSRTNVTVATFLNTLATQGNVNVGTQVTGTLPVANGGTGATTLTGILQGNGTGAVTTITNSSTVGQVLRVTGTNTYGWGALDLADTDAITGDLPLSNLAQGSALSVLGVANNAIADNASIAAATDHQVLRRSGTTLGFGAINLAQSAAVTGTLPIANGGTGSATQNFVDLTTNQASIAGNKTFTGNTTFSNNVTINGTPSANTDAATVGWVLNNVAGLRSGSVRGATTGSLTATAQTATTITLGGTSFTHDGVTYANGDTILVKDSVTGGGGGTFNNGVYSVSGIGSSVLLTRVDWMNTAGETDGVYVLVQDGTANVGTLWFTVSEVTTLGTDPISFTQIQTTGTVGGTGNNNRIAYWTGTNTIDDAASSYTNGSVFAFGTTTAATSTILTTKGTSTGNTTYGILHQDSGNNQVFRVADDGTTVIGGATTLTITPTTLTGSSTIQLSTAVNSSDSINLRTTGNTGTVSLSTTSSSFATKIAEVKNTATITTTSGSAVHLALSGTIAPTSGTLTHTGLHVQNTINQTGTSNGITRGIHINPTLTAASDYRGLEITATASHYAIWSTAGKVRFDLGSDATGDLLTRAAGGELARIGAGTSGHVLTSNGAGTAPTWQAPTGGGGTTVTRAYITNQTTGTFDLDANTGVVKDRNGNNVAFTIPTATDQFFVYLNGQLLQEGGTGNNRDYSVNTTTHVLTLSDGRTLVTDDELVVVKFS